MPVLVPSHAKVALRSYTIGIKPILRARNAVYARTRAELAKQKGWVFPRVDHSTSPVGPGAWRWQGRSQ